MQLRRKKYLATSFLILTWSVIPILGLQSSSLKISSKGKISLPFRGKGVNYLSLNHMYSSKYTTDDVLRRDFYRFQQDGINVISLSLQWYRLEGNTRGSYDGEEPYILGVSPGGPYGKRVLDDVKRVIRIANEYGIRVLVTFHTLWGDDSIWCTPDYVIDPITGSNIGLAVVRDDEMRQAFIDMFNHTVNYLAGTPGIWAWAILNEPWYWPTKLPPPYEHIDQKENFIQLFEKLSDIVKTLDGRPVTIRFVSVHTHVRDDGTIALKNEFVFDWNWDQRVFNALDFISFNVYPLKYPEIYGDYMDIVRMNVNGSIQLGKKVWLTEFGLKSDDDSIQEEGYRKMLTDLKNLPFEGMISWYWQSDSSRFTGKGGNICADANTGEGRPSYYELIRS